MELIPLVATSRTISILTRRTRKMRTFSRMWKQLRNLKSSKPTSTTLSQRWSIPNLKNCLNFLLYFSVMNLTNSQKRSFLVLSENLRMKSKDFWTPKIKGQYLPKFLSDKTMEDSPKNFRQRWLKSLKMEKLILLLLHA